MKYFNPKYKRILEGTHIGSLGDKPHPIGGWYINYIGRGFKRISLYEYELAPENTFSIVLHPGDTCAQAKQLYDHITNNKIEQLQKEGWISKSHFHFSWQSSNIIFTSGDKALLLADYINIWRKELHQTHKCKYIRDEFDELKKWLFNLRIISNADVEYFNEYFSKSGYNSANICPGIVHYFPFAMNRLNDPQESLIEEIENRIRGLLTVYAQ